MARNTGYAFACLGEGGGGGGGVRFDDMAHGSSLELVPSRVLEGAARAHVVSCQVKSSHVMSRQLIYKYIVDANRNGILLYLDLL
jgi:hypothetical protein